MKQLLQKISWQLFALFLISLHASAQYTVNNYSFQQQPGNYIEIAQGTVLGNENIDEQVFNASTTGSASIVNGAGFPIGFPFAFGGQVFTRFAVGTNGYINLGNDNFSIANTVASAFTGAPFNQADTIAYANMLAALHADLQGQAGSELSFKTVGTAPNRECVVQWKKFRIYLATADDFNFQIRLQENGNRVVFSYGTCIMESANRKVSVGIRGEAYNVVHMRKAELSEGETWDNSTKSLDRTMQGDIQTAFLPSNGLQYIFYNVAGTANDIGLDKASLSANVLFGCVGSTAEAITVRVFNYGESTQTSLPYQVKINDNPVQDGVLSLDPPLAKNQFRVVAINQTVDLSQPAPLRVKIWSKLAGDTGLYTINDTSAINTEVFAPAASPYEPVNSFSEFISRGWKTYRGRNKPESPNGRFIAGTQFVSGTASIQVQGFGTDTISDWLVSPAIQPLTNLRLKFRAAITDFDTSTSLTTGIDNDEIRILISDNCGTSWNTLYTFDNNSVTGGAISNIKKGFSVPLPPASGPFQIAVHVTNKGTSPQGTYFFHLDDLTINQGNSYDLGTRSVSIDNQNNPNCNQTSFTVRARIKNEGDSSLSSSAASVQVNNASPVVQNFSFNPVLQPGDSTEIVFSSVAVTPNSNVKLLVRTLLSTEDGFSAGNDTAAIRFVYVGSENPLTLPQLINFDNLPSGIPAGWLAEQNQSSDFRVRVRGTNSTRSLSALFFSGNKSSIAISPTTAVLPENYQLTFDMRLKNDLPGSFNFSANDSVTLGVSTNCGASWTTIFIAKPGMPFGFDNFKRDTIDLSTFAGSAISLRIAAVINRNDNTGAWLDFDNFQFSPVTSVEGSEMMIPIGFYPNPASQKIRFEIPSVVGTARIRLLGLNGSELRSGLVSNGSEWSLENLPSGFYLIEMATPKGRTTAKLIRE